jgi:hypothetical protein
VIYWGFNPTLAACWAKAQILSTNSYHRTKVTVQ